jgi:hypothetical protein
MLAPGSRARFSPRPTLHCSEPTLWFRVKVGRTFEAKVLGGATCDMAETPSPGQPMTFDSSPERKGFTAASVASAASSPLVGPGLDRHQRPDALFVGPIYRHRRLVPPVRQSRP